MDYNNHVKGDLPDEDTNTCPEGYEVECDLTESECLDWWAEYESYHCRMLDCDVPYDDKG